MLSLLPMFISIIIQTHSYDFRDNYKMQLKDKVHYKIEQNVGDNDYEMIKKDELDDVTVNIKEKRELNKLASKQYDDMLKINKDRFKGINWITAIVTHRRAISQRSKPTTSIIARKPTATTPQVTQHMTPRQQISMEPSEQFYDYNSLLNEYYEESMSGALSNDTYHPKSDSSDLDLIDSIKKLVSLDTQTVNCKPSNEIGLTAVICLLAQYKAHTESPRALAWRFWKILKAWLFVYLVVATPLWCTRGWCCCCLYCKFFKPYQTIEEAKNYLVSNPPGVLHTRKGKILEYEPSEREKERYEEFEHLLKTI